MSPVNFDRHAWFVIASLAAQDSLLKIPVPKPPDAAGDAAHVAATAAEATAAATAPGGSA
jgi:hypothetical protein